MPRRFTPPGFTVPTVSACSFRSSVSKGRTKTAVVSRRRSSSSRRNCACPRWVPEPVLVGRQKRVQNALSKSIPFLFRRQLFKFECENSDCVDDFRDLRSPDCLADRLIVWIASGPFTSSDTLSYEPLCELFDAARKCPPHVIVLVNERRNESRSRFVVWGDWQWHSFSVDRLSRPGIPH